MVQLCSLELDNSVERAVWENALTSKALSASAGVVLNLNPLPLILLSWLSGCVPHPLPWLPVLISDTCLALSLCMHLMIWSLGWAWLLSPDPLCFSCSGTVKLFPHCDCEAPAYLPCHGSCLLDRLLLWSSCGTWTLHSPSMQAEFRSYS